MSAIEAAAWALTILVASGCVWAVVTGRPGLALGVLVAAASFSGVTAPILGVGVRLEQPAVVAMAVILAMRRPRAVLSTLRAARWPVALATLYLAANVASSLLFAPDPAQSLKICLWLAISILAGGVATILILEGREGAPDRHFVVWLVAAGCVHALVAAAQVTAELLIDSDWGLLRGDAPLGKAFGLAWEPNLLAINLAAALIFLLDPITRQRFGAGARISAIILISAGIGLALSRGGLLALVAGVAVLALSLIVAPGRALAMSRGRTLLGEASLAFAIAVGGYVGLVWLGASGVGLRPGDIAYLPPQPEATLMPVGAPASTARPSETAAPGTTPSPVPSASVGPRYSGSSDTIGLRWRNLQVALSDGLTSPIVGLGSDTFGQRYTEPTCRCPAHIPNELSATFYESGLVGLLSLLGLICLVLLRAWQVRLSAYVASLVVLVVGYQFTDAMRFASSWVLLGAAIGLIVVSSGGVAAPFSRAPSGKP